MQEQYNKKIVVSRIFAFLCSIFLLTTTFAGTPLWTFEPLTDTKIVVPANAQALVQYRITNQSSKSHTLTMESIRGISQVTTAIGACGNPFVLKSKASCILSLEVNGSQLDNPVKNGPIVCQQGNKNQCYRPSSANLLDITPGTPTGATITVNPSALNFVQNATGNVIVTNSISSSVAANNVIATIPGGSSITIQSTTCGSSLAIGASCTITFASGTAEGPTTIPIAGSNTNTVNVDVTVTAQPQISITNPVQQNRIVSVSDTALSLEITNDAGSLENANAITVSNKTACPNLSVDDSNCVSVAPGATCLLQLTSNEPYAPCTITISGSNTANSPQALIAFLYSVGGRSGLVFESAGGSGKMITRIDIGQTPWTAPNSDISGATSTSQGADNTNAIVYDVDQVCANNPLQCAAQQCVNFGSSWYLPAVDELVSAENVLCGNQANPCNFGEFVNGYYWSSTQSSVAEASSVAFTFNNTISTAKSNLLPIRCIRAFSPP